MSQPVVEVKNLSKIYSISHRQEPQYASIRDEMVRLAKLPLRLMTGERMKKEQFWALKDVSFEVMEGDVLGIIGRNGSGKTTLLKILSRIVEPTEGKAIMRGKVASLLEVGTGFHPELTGRENIYFNGSILGMNKREIDSKFDEIVEFSEIEEFLDTPLKFYSSGMYVRLAFAVAAHLEPEILMVDEVLAVGDTAFQKKCLGKMESAAQAGRTVLFVSHNMMTVERLCTRAIYIKEGRIVGQDENVKALIREYLNATSIKTDASGWNNTEGVETSHFAPWQLYIGDNEGKGLAMPITNQEDSYVLIKGEVLLEDPALQLGYALYSDSGEMLFISMSTDGLEVDWPMLSKGPVTLMGEVPKNVLNEGVYRVELLVGLHNKQWLFEPSEAPSITLSVLGGMSSSPYWTKVRPGMLAPLNRWLRK